MGDKSCAVMTFPPAGGTAAPNRGDRKPWSKLLTPQWRAAALGCQSVSREELAIKAGDSAAFLQQFPPTIGRSAVSSGIGKVFWLWNLGHFVGGLCCGAGG